MTTRSGLRGMLRFIAIWLGQVVSVFGSGLTGFALGVWVYQRTGSATLFALIALFGTLPGIVVSPIVGALVDRWDRRRAMILCNAALLLTPLTIALLLAAGNLQLWHIYVVVAASSLFTAFHQPAFMASITLLVPREQYGRANGLVQLGLAAARILSPVLAGILIVSFQIWTAMLIDAATFVFAIITLLLVYIPRPVASAEGQASQGALIREATYGWTYIRARPGLLALLIFFAITNFTLGIVQTLITPLVLGFADAAALGRVLSVSGLGMLVGGVAMSVWGGPRHRVAGILGFTLLQGLILLLGGLRPSVALIGVAAFVFLGCSMLVNGCSQVIWQSKVAPDVQGRVFAIRTMIAWSSLPLAYAVAGPLADYVFNPLLVPGGPLAASLGQIIGVGPGRGVGLLFIVLGLLIVAAVIGAYLYPRLRMVEAEIPDAAIARAPDPTRTPPAGQAPARPAETAPGDAPTTSAAPDTAVYAALPEHTSAAQLSSFRSQTKGDFDESRGAGRSDGLQGGYQSGGAVFDLADGSGERAGLAGRGQTRLQGRVPGVYQGGLDGYAAAQPAQADGRGHAAAVTDDGRPTSSREHKKEEFGMSSQASVSTPVAKRRLEQLLTPPTVAGPATVLLIALIVVLGLYLLAPPAVVPASAPATTFSAARARAHLDPIVHTPRPLGSTENARVRDYIVDQLRAIGMEPEVQQMPLLASTDPNVNALLLHAPSNVIARLKGTNNTKAILLVAHYDSVTTSASANDGASNTAMLLEVASALRAGPAPRNDVIFLFTDGEELHLLGSQAFLTQHPWAKDVGLVLNFVARGTGGPSLMFESSTRNGWLIGEFAKAAPHPVANSLTYEVYRGLLPNDTDFTPFKRADYTGLNFAYIGGLEHYHTMLDDLQHVNEPGIQHQGEQALALTRHFGSLDLTNTKSGDAVYFDLLGLTLVHYSGALVLPLTALIVLLFAGVVVLGFRRKRLSGWGIFFGLLAFVGSVVVGAGVTALLWAGIRLIHSGYRAMPWGATYNGNLYMIAFIALAVAIVSAMYVGLRMKLRTPDLSVGALLVLLILLIATSVARPGISYLLAWPLLFSLVALGYTFTATDAATLSWKRLAALLLGALPGLVLFIPIIYLMYQAINLPMSWIIIAVVVLLLATLVPHLQLLAWPNKWLLPGIAGAACVGCLLAGSLTAGFDAGHRKPNSIFYVFDADQNTALWATTDERPDEWTSQFLAGPLARDTLAAYFPFTERTYLTASAPTAPIAQPQVTVVDNKTSGDVQNLRLHINSPRKGNVLVTYFYVAPQSKVRVEGNGRQIETTPRGNVIVVGYAGPPEGGFDLNVQLQPAQPIKLAVTDIAYGLPSIPGTSFRPRPENMMPTPFFEVYQDMSFVHKWFNFSPDSAPSAGAASTPGSK